MEATKAIEKIKSTKAIEGIVKRSIEGINRQIKGENEKSIEEIVKRSIKAAQAIKVLKKIIKVKRGKR